MSTSPNPQIAAPMVRPRGLSGGEFAMLSTALAVLGLSIIWPDVRSLWRLWTTDGLNSIGMVVPLVSLVLILRAWKSIGWETSGTWWGLVLLLITWSVLMFRQHTLLLMIVSLRWSFILPPLSLVLFAYGSGVVLLLGGPRLYRAALFPIVLLGFANPFPHGFSLFVDLPLQRLSAHVARSFATALGQQLSPDQLRLMFTPDFGMFIAPGCDGIRGAVTMAFIALIAGYCYRFRHSANALAVVGSFLLGYVFNLLRLCSLVLYYELALHFPWLEDKAENADYLIGAALFLLATLLLFATIHRLRDTGNPSVLKAAPGPERCELAECPSRTSYARLAAMAAVVLFVCAGLARANAGSPPDTAAADAPARFPSHLGHYSLIRSWNETLATGPVLYWWAQYAPADGGTPIEIGVSPVFGVHDPLLCHLARGENPIWQGQLTASTLGFVPIPFNSAFYTNRVTQYVEASTECSGADCGEFATDSRRLGFVYSRLVPTALIDRNAGRTIPVLLRAETADLTIPHDAARQRLTKDIQTFLASVSLDDLIRPAGARHP